MKKYLISLAKDQHRRELFFSQADTQDFKLFSALNTMNESWENLTALFDVEGFSTRYGRHVTQGEIGCTLSHLGVYQQIVEDKQIDEEEYCLVCEDDALFNLDFKQHLRSLLAQKPTADLILVGQSKITNFNAFELEINYPTTFSFWRKRIANTPFCYAYPYKNYFAGTVAYLIKKSAAKRFLTYMQQYHRPFWLADDFILFGSEFKLDIVVVRPLLVIENPQLVSNLESSRGSLSNNVLKKLVKYPLKKLLAVLRNF